MSTKTWDIRKFDRITKMKREGFCWEEINDYFANDNLDALRANYYRRMGPTRLNRPPVADEVKTKISELKLKGLSYSQIGAQIGKTKSAVSGLVDRWKL